MSLASQLVHDCCQLTLVCHKYITRLAAVSRSYDASLFELVHESSGTIIAYREAALNHAGAALLRAHNGACCFFKVGIKASYLA